MMFRPFVLVLLTPLLMLAGCNDDDPVNDTGIEDVIKFDIADFKGVDTSDDLNGIWVAVLEGDDSSFSRDKSGDRKYGEQSAQIYFVIKGGEGNYQYANCFDTGTLDGDYDRGDYDRLTVANGEVVFDSDVEGVDENDDDIDDKLSEEGDYSNTGTLTDNLAITSVFTFNDGDTVEQNTFQMKKVSNVLPDEITIGSASFENTTDSDPDIDRVACFAQWSGSYSTSDGLYTVNRFDASFDDNTLPFSASEFFSDDDITEYQVINYDGTVVSGNSKNGDFIDLTFSQLVQDRLTFTISADGYNVENAGHIVITHDDLD